MELGSRSSDLLRSPPLRLSPLSALRVSVVTPLRTTSPFHLRPSPHPNPFRLEIPPALRNLPPPMKLASSTPNRVGLVLALALGSLAPAALRADEGMWLYSAAPREQIKAKYGFELTDAWLEHLMKSSVRFNSGGS